MSTSDFVKLPKCNIEAPIAGPPGLNLPNDRVLAKGLDVAKPSFCTCGCPFLQWAAFCYSCGAARTQSYVREIVSQDSDDTSVGSDGAQSDTTASLCDGEHVAQPLLQVSTQTTNVKKASEKTAFAECRSKLKSDAKAFVP